MNVGEPENVWNFDETSFYDGAIPDRGSAMSFSDEI
jgi:hypothetical protein